MSPESSPSPLDDEPLYRRVVKKLGSAAAGLTPKGFEAKAQRRVDAKWSRNVERYVRSQLGEPTPSLGRRALRAMKNVAPPSLMDVYDSKHASIISKHVARKPKARR